MGVFLNDEFRTYKERGRVNKWQAKSLCSSIDFQKWVIEINNIIMKYIYTYEESKHRHLFPNFFFFFFFFYFSLYSSTIHPFRKVTLNGVIINKK